MTLDYEEILPFIFQQYSKYKTEFSRKNDLSLYDAINVFKSTTSINDLFKENFNKGREEKLLEVQKLLTVTTDKIKKFDNTHLETLYYYFKHLRNNTDINIYQNFVHFWSHVAFIEGDRSWHKYTPDFLISLNRALWREGFIQEYEDEIYGLRAKIYKESEYNKLSQHFHKGRDRQPEVVELRNSKENFRSFLKKVEIADQSFDDYEKSVEAEEKLILQSEILSSMSSDSSFIIYLIEKLRDGLDISEKFAQICKDIKFKD